MIKRPLIIVGQIIILYIFSLAGMWVQQLLHLRIPGSVIGLILLFIFLMLKIIRTEWVKEGATFMTTHLVLFFIPATVGIMNFYQLFIGKGFILIIITIVSTWMVMAASGYVTESTIRPKQK